MSRKYSNHPVDGDDGGVRNGGDRTLGNIGLR